MLLWLILILLGLSFIIYFFQVLALRKKLSEEIPNSFTQPISIIKPLKGLDDNLFDNIESFCKQDYPEYEVILSLENRNDPAYRVAEKIRNKYPDRVTIVIDNSSKALNPKVKNMMKAYRISKYDYFLISDSNVCVEDDYLRKTVSSMTEDVGLVTNLIVGVGGKSFGAVLENLQLNSFIILSVCLLDKFLKMPCSIGKSMLMRKKDFEEIGGFNAVQDVLAEDYLIGKLMHEKGKKVVLSNYMIKNINEYWSIKRFFNRHTRWAKIRWKIGGVKYFTEPLANPVFIASLIPLFYAFSNLSLILLLLSVLIKTTGDYLVMRMIKEKPGIQIMFSPIKDLMSGIIWFVPFITSKVNWRGNLYLISENTVLMPVTDSSLKRTYLKLKTIFSH
ncbi:Ceramide glucosyltransferase [Thermodesulfovibrio sp. N1]|uniref:ceramide glucosyltransferase n=1 Tax=Thermodesulfovibrio sp. N1 TaxID=1871110 RepID=UPI00083B40DD|nr:ceramide glucosyltransferase [Thermodesulfovibrio sp. N1]ODA44367.1 Ceramide glucosyltransferase [Thermodesulfovibrio sp. N1]